MEILGDKGSLVAENPSITTFIQRTPQGIQKDCFHESFLDRYAQAYDKELHHFVQVILGKEVPTVTHDDARKVSIIAEAAQRSAETGQKIQIQYN